MDTDRAMNDLDLGYQAALEAIRVAGLTPDLELVIFVLKDDPDWGELPYGLRRSEARKRLGLAPAPRPETVIGPAKRGPACVDLEGDHEARNGRGGFDH